MSEDGTRVSVLFFARFRELAGTARREMEVPPGTSVEGLLRRLREEEGLDLPGSTAVAVNRSYAAPETELAEGDEVAIVPPVAGG